MMANKQAPLKTRKYSTPQKICLSHIFINSIRDKLDSLLEFTYGLANFLAVSETKLGSSFPTGKFKLPGFRTSIEKIYWGRVEDYLFM